MHVIRAIQFTNLQMTGKNKMQLYYLPIIVIGEIYHYVADKGA